MGVASVTLGQWQVKPGGGPVVTSQDPPLEQGRLWQRSIFTSHRWPVVGVRLEVTPGFGGCLLIAGSAHAMWARRRCWGLLRGEVWRQRVRREAAFWEGTIWVVLVLDVLQRSQALPVCPGRHWQ